MPGIVHLVGAGPGDPGLVTRRALELVRGADVVVHDRLVPDALLAEAGGERRYVGKEPGRPSLPQAEINALLVELGRAGKTVVRLKGGDPFVFGRGGEEAQALAAAGVPFEVVPGVTAGIAATAYAGIPVTHREEASAVAFVTGHEDPGKPETALDWDALARFPGTLVFYMGVRQLPAIAERLAAAGTAADWCAADLRDERATRDAVAAARARFGRIDGLCQVAGGSGRGFGDGPLHEVTLEAWDATLALNLSTQFLVMRETLRVMLEQPPGPAGRGSIVLMSSVSSFRPAPARFAAHAYAAAKAAVLGLVRATAAYYAPSGIRVNAVVPGLVRTPMSTRAQGDPSVQADAARRQPLTGAFLEPADVAATIVHLLADESRAVTGQLVAVDGGWSVSDASGWAGPAAPA